MEIIFLGTGEAFDENIPNNSQLIISDKVKLLLDCGMTVASQVWKFDPNPNLLDAVYISHQHADHLFGLPGLLLRMWQGGRKKDLTVICQKKLKKSFKDFMEFAYEGFMRKFDYEINLIESDEKKEIILSDLKLNFQKTIHSGENLAVKIADGKNTIVYGGDGSPISGNEFYKNLDLLTLETYLYDTEKIGHSTVVSAIKFAEENNVKCLALTHLNRDFRKNELEKIKDKIKSNKLRIVIPEPLESIIL